MINYLARLGWSHGDDELFSRAQLVEWFDSSNMSKSAAQFDPEKLKWVNAHYMKQADKGMLLADLTERMSKAGYSTEGGPALADVLDVVLERASTLVELRDEANLFYKEVTAPAEELQPMLDEAVIAALKDFSSRLDNIEMNVEAVGALVKDVLKAHNLKMPKLAMPVRLLLTGIKQTPSIDKVIVLLGKAKVQHRISAGLGA
jgi:glutamyl-tRNA synthetase